MKNQVEIFGVTSLWLAGMTTVATSSWPTWALVASSLLATIGVVLYAIVAIRERRKNNAHYFTMAFLSVVLAFISLAVAAFAVKGGPLFVMYVLSVVLFGALAYLVYTKCFK